MEHGWRRRLAERAARPPGKPHLALGISLLLHGALLAAAALLGVRGHPAPAPSFALAVERVQPVPQPPDEPVEARPLPREPRLEPPRPEFRVPEPALPDFEPEVEPLSQPVPLEPLPDRSPGSWLRPLRHRRTESPVPRPAPPPRPHVEPTPVPGHNPPPKYPRSAIARGVEGRVLLSVVVDASGAVVELRIVRSSGSRLLDEAAYAAVRRWRFANGPGRTLVEIRFELRGPDEVPHSR